MELPFLSNSINVESLWLFVPLVATVTNGGARGDINWADVVTVGTGDADVLIVDNGGGAGATNPERDDTVSVLPMRNKKYNLKIYNYRNIRKCSIYSTCRWWSCYTGTPSTNDLFFNKCPYRNRSCL